MRDKFCSGCKKWKSYSEFNKRTDSTHAQYRSQCKRCIQDKATIQQRERRAKNPLQWRAYMDAYRINNRKRISEVGMNSHYRRKFNLSAEGKAKMLAQQGGICAICGTNTPKSKKGFVVDHNERTNRVRAILCAPCNTGIGHLRHSSFVLERAAIYMEAHDVIDERSNNEDETTTRI